MRKLFLSVKDGLYQRFRRQTSSTAFIPEIDGLRFLAIALVVISHIQSLYLLRRGFPVSFSKEQALFQPLLENGDNGVFLFFAISGFVLMLPFARHNLCGGGRVPLKKYYLRRLTRLEPPYFLAMVFLFVMKVLVQHQDFAYLLPHLGATLLYLHTAIYHEMSKITPITWSLEVEIQFYLLAPFLAAVYRLSKVYRRTLLCLLILLTPIFQQLCGLSQYSFLGTMQYFFVGFLLVDFYLCRDRITIRENVVIPLGIILLLCLILVRPFGFQKVILYLFFMTAFYYMVLNTEFWNRAFQNRLLTSIGGMCYSIYLLHFAIISLIGTKSFAFHVSGSYILNILVQIFVQIPILLLISAVYYLLIEKPCMDPGWPQKMVQFFRSRIKR